VEVKLTRVQFQIINSTLQIFVEKDLLQVILDFMSTDKLSEGHLGCFHGLATANNAVMNMRLQITFSFLLRYLFILDILRSETDGSYRNYIFNCLRKFHTVPVCIPANRLHPLQHFLSLDFLITATLSGVR